MDKNRSAATHVFICIVQLDASLSLSLSRFQRPRVCICKVWAFTMTMSTDRNILIWFMNTPHTCYANDSSDVGCLGPLRENHMTPNRTLDAANLVRVDGDDHVIIYVSKTFFNPTCQLKPSSSELKSTNQLNPSIKAFNT